ncbi:hypothetical protein DVH24_018448 [Malus domestica]|uniref:Uncharacterized protein n=1 Tax=Malus domestica TaxID=3750 RepID=A0A498KGB5_MALDO|nr:hypothetical protein DVH24_018448 [Malus domestica]
MDVHRRCTLHEFIGIPVLIFASCFFTPVKFYGGMDGAFLGGIFAVISPCCPLSWFLQSLGSDNLHLTENM